MTPAVAAVPGGGPLVGPVHGASAPERVRREPMRRSFAYSPDSALTLEDRSADV